METLLTFAKKFIAFLIAYATTVIGGYVWLDSKIKAAEANAVQTMKEYRQQDMQNLNQRLDDIKSDVGIIKKALIEGRK